MVYTDLTPLFRSLISENAQASSSSSRPTSPTNDARSRSSSRGGGSRRKRVDAAELEKKRKEEEFLKEAYRIHNHLTTLSLLLRSIRRPYLSTQPPPLHTQRRSRLSAGDGDEDALKGLEGAKWLSDRERDEIDLRAKIMLRNCRDRVGILEEGEKIRQQTQPPHPPTSLLTTLLPSLAAAPTTATHSSAILTAHRATICLYLTQSIMSLTTRVSSMQEERAKRREERGRNLGGMVKVLDEGGVVGGEGGMFGWLGGEKGKGRETAVNLTIPTAPSSTSRPSLSPQQLQLFASENNALLESMSSTLASVQKAESSILSISELQTTLIQHLQTQAESIEKLFDDAVGTVGDVERANKELKKARERGGEARWFLLVFLIGAAVALLFLDWYD